MNNLKLIDEATEERPDDEELNELSGVDISDEYDDDDDDEPDDDESDLDDPIRAAWGYGEQSERRD